MLDTRTAPRHAFIVSTILDEPWAYWASTVLSDCGWVPTANKTDDRSPKRWAEGVRSAVSEASLVVVTATPHTLSSPHVAEELREAESARIPIIGLLVDDSPLPQEVMRTATWVRSGSRPMTIDRRFRKALSDVISQKRDPADGVQAPSSTPALQRPRRRRNQTPRGLADAVSVNYTEQTAFLPPLKVEGRGAGSLVSLVPVAAPSGFVGRADEMARLTKMVEPTATRMTEVQVVGIAGTGKTWLVREFLNRNPTGWRDIVWHSLAKPWSELRLSPLTSSLLVLDDVESRSGDEIHDLRQLIRVLGGPTCCVYLCRSGIPGISDETTLRLGPFSEHDAAEFIGRRTRTEAQRQRMLTMSRLLDLAGASPVMLSSAVELAKTVPDEGIENLVRGLIGQIERGPTADWGTYYTTSTDPAAWASLDRWFLSLGAQGENGAGPLLVTNTFTGSFGRLVQRVKSAARAIMTDPAAQQLGNDALRGVHARLATVPESQATRNSLEGLATVLQQAKDYGTIDAAMGSVYFHSETDANGRTKVLALELTDPQQQDMLNRLALASSRPEVEGAFAACRSVSPTDVPTLAP